MNDPNKLSPDLRAKLANLEWSPTSFVDLHKLGVHYYTPDYLPAHVNAPTYSELLHRGLTPPTALPIYNGPDTKERIEQFLEFNYFKLTDAGVQYLGVEANVQKADAWDKAKVKVCLCRLSDYHTLDGAFGGFLIGNFLTDFTSDEELFVDYSFFPAPADIPKFYEAGLPIMFGNISHRPLTDFDVVIIATSYLGERVNLPVAMVKSGLPLYRWQRFSKDLPYREKCPVVALAGIGASFIENMLGDNPIHGPAGNAVADHVLIGEGEMMDLKYIQRYSQVVKDDGGSKEDFCRALTNANHLGVYDPSLVLFEYADKQHTTRDFQGNQVDQKTYGAGGHIKNIYLLDHEQKIKYAMAGQHSEEFRELEPMQAQYQLKIVGNMDPAELGRRYVKISDKPNIAERKSAGMAPQGPDTQKQVMAERKEGVTRVAQPAAR